MHDPLEGVAEGSIRVHRAEAHDGDEAEREQASATTRLRVKGEDSFLAETTAGVDP